MKTRSPSFRKLEHPPHRGRAKAVAKSLTKLAQRFPEFTSILANSLTDDGQATMEKLTRYTKLPRPRLQTILDTLVATERVFTTTKKSGSTLGGRPTILYQPFSITSE